ncbi:MAG TPA: hypothetical protein VNF99_11295 [Stellaceae bacterium]|nr:hypothetical protein [Stellaceae bacterium]
MAHLDLIETRATDDWEALYWWRRDAARDAAAAATLVERLATLAARAAPALPRVVDLPGNRLRANTEQHRMAASLPRAAAVAALDPDLLAALRRERRNAAFALATGLVATAAPAAAAVYAAAARETVALGFAMAGTFAASFALYHAARWLLLMRSAELPSLLA